MCRDAGLNRQMHAAKDFTTICASAPSEVLALIAVRAADRLIGRALDGITRNLGLIDEFVLRRAGAMRWVRPRGGSIGFPELLIDMPVAAFCERLVREHGVLLVPGSMFEVGTNHFRIGLGRASLPAGLAAMGNFIDELDGGSGASA